MTTEQNRFRKAVEKGLADVKAGRVMTLDKARRRLEKASAPSGKR